MKNWTTCLMQTMSLQALGFVACQLLGSKVIVFNSRLVTELYCTYNTAYLCSVNKRCFGVRWGEIVFFQSNENLFSSHFHFFAAYVPHLSLLYGDFTEDEKKKVQDKANILDDSISSLSFPVTRLALYKTDMEDKTFKSWEKIAEYNLEPK